MCAEVDPKSIRIPSSNHLQKASCSRLSGFINGEEAEYGSRLAVLPGEFLNASILARKEGSETSKLGDRSPLTSLVLGLQLAIFELDPGKVDAIGEEPSDVFISG